MDLSVGLPLSGRVTASVHKILLLMVKALQILQSFL